MEHPKLRDSKRLLTHEPYPLNEIPEKIITEIGKDSSIYSVLDVPTSRETIGVKYSPKPLMASIYNRL